MKKSLIIICLMSLIFGLSVNASAQDKERYARPFDEAPQDRSFKIFRDKLIRTVKNKNRAQLLAATDRNIQVSFGMENGIEDFKKWWNINRADSKLWDELLKVLEKGGKFIGTGRDKTFCAPYLFTAFSNDVDEFENQAIFGSNVNLRIKPHLNSEVITQLSYNIVKVDYENSVTTTTDANQLIWAKITTLGGKSGYVSADYVRSPIDYRACFAKKRGVWKMTAFIAGD